MKIIVDKLPDTPNECVFHKVEDGLDCCKLQYAECDLLHHKECEHLQPIFEMKPFKPKYE